MWDLALRALMRLFGSFDRADIRTVLESLSETQQAELDEVLTMLSECADHGHINAIVAAATL